MTDTQETKAELIIPEVYRNKIAAKSGDPRKWEHLSINQQNAVIQSMNILFAVLDGMIL